MTKEQFVEQLKNAFSLGCSIENPGRGFSTVVGIADDKLCYIRGSYRIYLPYSAIIDVLNEFSGKIITTTDLKDYNPLVFDSKRGGHDCNRTILFCLLERMGLTEGSIKGSGRRGSPFFVKLK